jgi:hypothetical protein
VVAVVVVTLLQALAVLQAEQVAQAVAVLVQVLPVIMLAHQVLELQTQVAAAAVVVAVTLKYQTALLVAQVL